jgi:hypothetical protein
MNDFLETCKARLAESQKHLAEAQQKLQRAQNEYQTAAAETNAFQHMVNFETRKVQEQQIGPQLPAATHPGAASVAASTRILEVNKTDLVRQLLRQHSGGMTAREVWSELKTQISNRNYLYSILKRLRDSDEVSVKRHKYVIKFAPKLGEARPNAILQ